jgi:hypothetical protein
MNLQSILRSACVARARARVSLAALAVAAAATSVHAQQFSLTTTYAGGNGQDGNMFNVTAVNTVTITSFDVHFGLGTVPFEVYSIAGGYQGNETNAAAWTLIGSGQHIVTTPQGTGQPLALAIDVTIQAGQTVGFYVTNTGGSAPNIIYSNGTGVLYQDANIQMPEGVGKAYPFGGTYTPRTWNGTVHYTLGSPCPSTTYCTAKASSDGCLPSIAHSGGPSMSLTSGFTITASNLPAGVFGTFVYSLGGRAAIPLYGGTLCIQPPVRKTQYALANTGGSSTCDGTLSIDFNAFRATGVNPFLVAGQQVNGQFFHRDPGFASPNNVGLSDAIEFTICP